MRSVVERRLGKRLAVHGLVGVVLAVALVGCNLVGQGGGVQPQPQGGGQPQAAGGGGGRSGGGQQASLPAVPVAVAAVETGALRAGPTFTGDVVALQQVNVVPRTAGIVTRLLADVGQEVTQGEVIAELERSSQDAAWQQAQAAVEVAQARLDALLAGPKETDVARAQAAVDQARSNLEAAQARLDAARAGGKAADIDTARINLENAQLKLEALRTGPRPEQRNVLQKDIEKAQNDLTAAQAKRNGDCNPNNRTFVQYTCDASQAAVNAAVTALNRAKLQYELATAPPTANDVAQAENAVKAAEQALEKAINPSTPEDIEQAQAAVDAQAALLRSAEAALEAALNPVLDSDIRVAEANLRSARAQLETARVNRDATFVTAPFTGVISARLAVEGGLVNTTSNPIYTLVSKEVGIDLPVSQELVSQLAVGQAAEIRTPALPGEVVPGVIASISPAGDQRSRSFTVRVTPDPQDGRLRPGMSASVSLSTVATTEALLVPTDAIIIAPGEDRRGVFVVEERDGNPVARFRAPTFGASTGRLTEVLSGLNVGDLVVIQGQSTLRNNQGVRLIGGGPAERGGDRRAEQVSPEP